MPFSIITYADYIYPMFSNTILKYFWKYITIVTAKQLKVVFNDLIPE